LLHERSIEEVAINAPPKTVWQSLLDIGSWFAFDPDPGKRPKMTLEPRVGAQWTSEARDGSFQSLIGTVTHIEPGKLLRMGGQMAMTHLPVMNALIWELVPQDDGKRTLLRFCQRTFGFLDADSEQKFQGGWKQLLPQLKAAAERASS
jgi:uncharacterized protein YndB with AHSA1/START domain